jgi:hypothetical protein
MGLFYEGVLTLAGFDNVHNASAEQANTNQRYLDEQIKRSPKFFLGA